MPGSVADRALIDSEASVLATFDFLAGENVVDEEDENLRCVDEKAYETTKL